jgi:hypothetical protein
MPGAQTRRTASTSDRGAAKAVQPSPEQRLASGKAARAKAPLEAHAEFRPARSRDPVALLLDHAALQAAATEGRVEAQSGV